MCCKLAKNMKCFVSLLVFCSGLLSQCVLSEKLKSQDQLFNTKNFNLDNEVYNQENHVFEDLLLNNADSPMNVTNFTCISFDYTNLTCTWTEPVNNVKTEYILYDFVHDNKDFKRICPVPIKPSGCQYRLDTKPVYIRNQEYLSFVLIGRNSLGESKQYFKIKHYEIIKPGLPTFVHFYNVTETSMIISISAPIGLQYREFVDGLVYSIKYYSASSDLDITKEVSVTTESGDASLELRDLVPYTYYRFDVRCHLNIKSDKFMWSDRKIANELTKSDVPYFAPVVHPSAFDYQNNGGNMIISIYWQPVPSEFENGMNFVYYIKYDEYFSSRFKSEASKKSSYDIMVGNETSVTIRNLDPEQAYIFTIVAANKKGKSTNETARIVIDETEKLLPGPQNISVISFEKDWYNISWKAPDVLYNHYVLFWCKSHKLSSTKCGWPVKMITVTNQTKHDLFLPDHNANYKFAVATVYNSQTSGMYWASRTVIHNITETTTDSSDLTSTTQDICNEYVCVNGKCEIIGRYYRCRCFEGFTGLRCEDRIVNKSDKQILWQIIQASIMFSCLILLTGVFCLLLRRKK